MAEPCVDLAEHLFGIGEGVIPKPAMEVERKSAQSLLHRDAPVAVGQGAEARLEPLDRGERRIAHSTAMW